MLATAAAVGILGPNTGQRASEQDHTLTTYVVQENDNLTSIVDRNDGKDLKGNDLAQEVRVVAENNHMTDAQRENLTPGQVITIDTEYHPRRN